MNSFIFLLLLLLVGCEEADFGQKAKDYVINHARRDSERLTQADFGIRFTKAYHVGLIEIINQQRATNRALDEYQITITPYENEIKNLKDVQAALKIESLMQAQSHLLITLLGAMERTESHLLQLAQLCRSSELTANGMDLVPLAAPLASFYNVQRVVDSTMPDLTVGVMNSGNPPRAGSEGPETEQLAFTASAVLLSSVVSMPVSFLITSATFSLYKLGKLKLHDEKEFEHQKKLFEEATNIYPKYVLSKEQALALAINHCQQAKTLYQSSLDQVKKNQAQLRELWQRMQTLTLDLRNRSHRIIAEHQIEYLMRSYSDPVMDRLLGQIDFERESVTASTQEMKTLRQLIAVAKGVNGCLEGQLKITTLEDYLDYLLRKFREIEKIKFSLFPTYYAQQITSLTNLKLRIHELYTAAQKRGCP